MATSESAHEARESELGKALDAVKTRADNAEKECNELRDELVRIKGQLQDRDEAKIIEKYKGTEAFSQAVADAGAPKVLHCWVVTKRHLKTNLAAKWESFVDKFLFAKDNLEKGLGEPNLFNGPNPAFLPALEDQAL